MNPRVSAANQNKLNSQTSLKEYQFSGFFMSKENIFLTFLSIDKELEAFSDASSFMNLTSGVRVNKRNDINV